MAADPGPRPAGCTVLATCPRDQYRSPRLNITMKRKVQIGWRCSYIKKEGRSSKALGTLQWHLIKWGEEPFRSGLEPAADPPPRGLGSLWPSEGVAPWERTSS